ncbi:MAG: protein-L-isoaspartate o-methyltransferase 1 [Chloroflexota bacterium]|nr:protein-L-isoaspartate o-methyltransferase 1 [Chloroflexota bacterium]
MLSESEAFQLAERAIEEAGGTRMVYRNPRQSFSLQATKTFIVDGYEVEVRWGEISSPAVASVGGYVFEIHDEEIEILLRPPRARPNAP